MHLEEMLARESIRQTLARYTFAGDRLRVDELAATFTPDGVLESEAVPEADRFRYEGRAEIAAWLGRWSERSNSPGHRVHGASFIRHHLSSCLIEFTAPESAAVRTYWTAWTDIGPDHAGYYVDRFSRVDGQWLIAHRRVRLDWRSEHSLFTTAVANSC